MKDPEKERRPSVAGALIIPGIMVAGMGAYWWEAASLSAEARARAERDHALARADFRALIRDFAGVEVVAEVVEDHGHRLGHGLRELRIDERQRSGDRNGALAKLRARLHGDPPRVVSGAPRLYAAARAAPARTARNW